VRSDDTAANAAHILRNAELGDIDEQVLGAKNGLGASRVHPATILGFISREVVLRSEGKTMRIASKGKAQACEQKKDSKLTRYWYAWRG
jgi:hypothetical protein